MPSRALLHLAAVVLPAAAAAVVLRNERPTVEYLLLCSAASGAAQIAVLIGWRLFDSAARRGGLWRAVLAGVVMAVLTHLLFGPAMALCWAVAGQFPPDFVPFVLLLSFGSLIVMGVATVPAVVIVNLLLNRLRRKELLRVAV